MALAAAMHRCGVSGALRCTAAQVCTAGDALAVLAGSCGDAATCQEELAAMVAACAALRRAMSA